MLLQSHSITHESVRNKQTHHGLGSATDLFCCVHRHHTAFVWVGSFRVQRARRVDFSDSSLRLKVAKF